MNIQNLWYETKPALRYRVFSRLLLPFSALFKRISQNQRTTKTRSQQKFSVPLVVVGNITVGGTGKTPLIQWLVQSLQQAGIRVGIVSRGYGGTGSYPLIVTDTTPPKVCGDEPALLAQSLSCPIVVDPNRTNAVNHLLDNFDVDVILSDDGLQHYKMHRDAEIIMLDGSRGIGNGRYLPAGPLRESVERLSSVDIVLAKIGTGQVLHSSMAGIPDFDLLAQVNGGLKCVHGKIEFPLVAGQKIHAVTGIGNPAPFFNELNQRGYQVETHQFADHYQFSSTDFDGYSQECIIMTEKDWVKCISFKELFRNVWVLPLSYDIPAATSTRIIELVKNTIRNHQEGK